MNRENIFPLLKHKETTSTLALNLILIFQLRFFIYNDYNAQKTSFYVLLGFILGDSYQFKGKLGRKPKFDML